MMILIKKYRISTIYFIQNKSYFLIFFIIILSMFSCQNKRKPIIYEPIGYFSTQYNISTGAPRQGMLDTVSHGIITIKPEYTEALKDLESFEYIWVIYHFHEAKGFSNLVNPPESDHDFGLFATRSPRRPNPIALSLTKLDSIKDNILYVSKIDAFNNSPIIDIKPFLPSVDYAVSIVNMETELYLGHHDQDFINDSLAKIFIKGEEKK